MPNETTSPAPQPGGPVAGTGAQPPAQPAPAAAAQAQPQPGQGTEEQPKPAEVLLTPAQLAQVKEVAIRASQSASAKLENRLTVRMESLKAAGITPDAKQQAALRQQVTDEVLAEEKGTPAPGLQPGAPQQNPLVDWAVAREQEVGVTLDDGDPELAKVTWPGARPTQAEVANFHITFDKALNDKKARLPSAETAQLRTPAGSGGSQAPVDKPASELWEEAN